MKLKILAVMSISLLLTACGGGSSGISSNSGAALSTETDTGGTTSQSEPTGNASATFTWSVPTTRESGAGLSMGELGGYRIFYGSVNGSLNSFVVISDPYITSYTFTNLVSSTTYYIQITAYDADGSESEKSNIVTRTAI